MASSNPSVIPFPVRSGTLKTTDPHLQLLKAAKVAERALTLAPGIQGADNNVVVRKLRSAIAEVELGPEPPTTPTQSAKRVDAECGVKLTDAGAAQLLRDMRSTECFCGMTKKSGRPFCLRCYHALPERIRASLYLSPLDSNQIFDAILEARVYLARLGMLSANEAIA